MRLIEVSSGLLALSVVMVIAIGTSHASSDGSLGVASQGESNISIEIAPRLELYYSDSNSASVSLSSGGTGTGDEALRTEYFCVNANTGTGLMQVSASSGNGGFNLNGSSGNVDYSLNLKQGDRVINVGEESNAPAVIETCQGRSAKKGASLNIRYDRKDLNRMPKNSRANGSLLITVEPV